MYVQVAQRKFRLKSNPDDTTSLLKKIADEAGKKIRIQIERQQEIKN